MALTHSTFYAHFPPLEYSLLRYCGISRPLHFALPSSFSPQYHYHSVEIALVASRLQLIRAQPATTTATTAELIYGRRPRYIIVSDDIESSEKSLSEKDEIIVSTSAVDENQISSLASDDNEIKKEEIPVHSSDSRSARIAPNQEANLVSKYSKPLSNRNTFSSDSREGTPAPLSQARDGELSSNRKLDFPVTVGSGGEFGRLPINLDLELYRARCLFRERKFKEAEEILRQCIKDWPTDGRAYVLLGTRLVKQRRFVDARAVYEDGCQAARGENPYIWQAWAILEQKVGHISEARKLFDAATAADVKHAAAWHGWALLELQQGSTKKARELLSKGIKFCGSNEYLYQTSALLEYRAGKMEEARALFSQAVHCNSRSCASWLAWALMEAEKGNVSTARYLFQRGIRASPKNRYTWQAWALFEANQGNRERARTLFEQGVELNPYCPVLLQAFALFEYDSSNPARARELFELAASLDPRHQPIWNAWGWMEWKEMNLDLARTHFKKSLSVNSRNANATRAYHAWATLEADAENYAAARELFKRALRVDSQNAPAWTSWIRLEENLGNYARAEEIRTQYLQQRTEVVEEAPWDVNLSSMLAPAINRIRTFFKIQTPSFSEEQQMTELMPEITEVVNRQRLDTSTLECDEDFDIEAFIREVLPWKVKDEKEACK